MNFNYLLLYFLFSFLCSAGNRPKKVHFGTESELVETEDENEGKANGEFLLKALG
jgi:hypothetical protein